MACGTEGSVNSKIDENERVEKDPKQEQVNFTGLRGNEEGKIKL